MWVWELTKVNNGIDQTASKRRNLGTIPVRVIIGERSRARRRALVGVPLLHRDSGATPGLCAVAPQQFEASAESPVRRQINPNGKRSLARRPRVSGPLECRSAGRSAIFFQYCRTPALTARV